jgi:hypothetical protein
MKFTPLKIFVGIISVLIIISCETGSSTAYTEKLVLFCYAQADSTIDSLYLTSTGKINEAINLENLGISGAAVRLFEREIGEADFVLAGTLAEYSERKGIYYLPVSELFGGFKTGFSYRIEAEYNGYDKVSAETVCPPPLENISARNLSNGTGLTSTSENPSAVDTLYYRRGRSYDDVRIVSCSFDSIPLIMEGRMASYRIVPDDLYRHDQSFWLEDTASAVWDKYPVETRIFKNKEKFGKDFMEYFIRSISIYWYAVYHGGMNTVIVSSTDRAFKSYMETLYDPDGRYTNVEGGLGLFSISNSSSDKSRYRVFVKSLEK